jgi:hypothetical protein
MKRIISISLLMTAALSSVPAYAGKVESVQEAIKKSCSKDVPSDEALRLVKSLFSSCVPGSKVEVDGCKVDCLKENSGAVVGQ